MTDDTFWQAIIQALLAIITAIEQWRGRSPTTCKLRRLGKKHYEYKPRKDET